MCWAGSGSAVVERVILNLLSDFNLKEIVQLCGSLPIIQ